MTLSESRLTILCGAWTCIDYGESLMLEEGDAFLSWVSKANGGLLYNVKYVCSTEHYVVHFL